MKMENRLIKSLLDHSKTKTKLLLRYSHAPPCSLSCVDPTMATCGPHLSSMPSSNPPCLKKLDLEFYYNVRTRTNHPQAISSNNKIMMQTYPLTSVWCKNDL